MTPRGTDADRRIGPRHHKLDDGFTLLSPAHGTVEANQELYLTYGAHANRKLFVEYGFANALIANPDSRDASLWEVDVQDMVEHLFLTRGTVGAWMKEILTKEGYWGYELIIRSISPP